MTRILTTQNLRVKIHDTREEMGIVAANDIADAIRSVLAYKKECNIIFAAAPSQSEMLAALIEQPGIEWNRVNAFHMDEYIGLATDAPQGFANFLRAAIFDKVPFHSVNCLDGVAATKDSTAECTRYAALLENHPVDITCMGIGENGHIAFNDPPVADFDDPVLVKPVELDEICRNQQVHDGCFAVLNEVPTHALTLTVPALMRAAQVFCVVPAATKSRAVHDTLLGEISTACPASILRRHPQATLYLDMDSARLL
jgi:glucosamine-6-phosphate deaminase